MTAGEVIATAGIAIALASFVVSIVAIRRDRATLIVSERESDGAAGTAFLGVVNVGLRPVRIVRLVSRDHRWRPWEPLHDLSHAVGTDPGRFEFPIVLAPADLAVVALPSELLALAGDVMFEDAAGHHHALGRSKLTA